MLLQPRLLGVLSCLFFVSIGIAQENWDGFRGPRGDGSTSAKQLPLEWSEQQNIAWKVPIHGLGWSSPVIWEDQIWLATATEDGTKLYGICLDKESGEVIHDLLLFEVAEPRFRHPTNSYASCTPVVEKGHIYFHFGSYGTACVETTSGKKLWERRDFVSDDFRGPGSSPILYDGKLFVNFDGFDFQFVVALDKKTGETVWKKTRDIDYRTDNGDWMKAYATPQVIQVEGQAQVVSPAAMATIAYDPDSGDELWRKVHGGMNAASRPLFKEGILYLTTGTRGDGLIALDPPFASSDSDNQPETLWDSPRSVPLKPSLIFHKGVIFSISDDGIASAREAKTGRMLWRQRLKGEFWSSPILANGLIYCFDQEGASYILSADEEGEVVAENHLDEGGNASPAIADNAIFLRTAGYLYRIENLPPQ
ncbi:Quinohemoprotein ethanol dehydrogenase [Planctomycetales bacterium 10988]|nr:Quinohemoprotein ethanol dehydrogenase [Planctomycetales bacterium 10988]